MNNTFLIVLGAILATLGGFIQKWYQERQDRKKQDKLLLVSVHSHILTLEHIRNFAESNADIGSIADYIYQISFEIQARKFKELRIKLKKFGKKHKRSNKFDQLDLTELESIEKKLIQEIGPEEKGGDWMNKAQKATIGISIILIGCILIMFIALTTDIMFSWKYVPEFTISSLFVVILGIVLISGGLIVLFSKNKS